MTEKTCKSCKYSGMWGGFLPICEHPQRACTGQADERNSDSQDCGGTKMVAGNCGKAGKNWEPR